MFKKRSGDPWKADCVENDWLFLNENFTITSVAFSSIASNVFAILRDGHVNSGYASNGGSVYPVVYLKKNALVESGDGSIDSPFKLINE